MIEAEPTAKPQLGDRALRTVSRRPVSGARPLGLRWIIDSTITPPRRTVCLAPSAGRVGCRAVLMVGHVQFRILGSVGVAVDGVPLPIGAPRQRALLALLLLDANRPLHPHSLIDGIWGDAIPQHPDAALQIVVSRLRTSMGVVSDRLTSEPGGYRIDVADDELDLLVARRNIPRSQALWDENDFTGAAEAADAALSCWDGEALADLRDAPFYDAAFRELHELHFAVYEIRNRAYLNAAAVTSKSSPTSKRGCALEPWRERIRAHHMVALYRAGRRVDALAVYEDLCRCLAEELGVEPSRLHAGASPACRRTGSDPARPTRRASSRRFRRGRRAGFRSSGAPTRSSRSSTGCARSRRARRGWCSSKARPASASRGSCSRPPAECTTTPSCSRSTEPTRCGPGCSMIAAALAEASSRLSATPSCGCVSAGGRGMSPNWSPRCGAGFPNLPPATRGRRRSAGRAPARRGRFVDRRPVATCSRGAHARRHPSRRARAPDAPRRAPVDEEPKRVLVLATARSAVSRRVVTARTTRAAASQRRGVLDRIAAGAVWARSRWSGCWPTWRIPEAEQVAARSSRRARRPPLPARRDVAASPTDGASPASSGDLGDRIRSLRVAARRRARRARGPAA